MYLHSEQCEAFDRLLTIMDELRVKCPWDRKQTFESLRQNTIEETYELASALIKKDMNEIAKELGDVLLQVVLHSQVAADEGEFTIDDVCETINDKMIRRHPHVFANVRADNANEVADLWEQVKLAEKERIGEQAGDKQPGLLDDVPAHFPALLQAQKISRRAVAAGFEWETLDDVWDKVAEERAELEAAYNAAPKTPDGKVLREEGDSLDNRVAAVEMEFGDLLFALVNVARKMGIDAEAALRASNGKFRRRFAIMEEKAREHGRTVEELSLDEMEEYWQKAKEEE